MMKPLRQCLRWTVTALFCILGPVHASGSPELRVEVGGHTAAIRQIAIGPDEKWGVTVSDDKTARVWNLETQEMRAVLRVPIGPAKLGGLYSAAISPLGDLVAVAGTTGSDQKEHRIYLFNIETASLINVINAQAGDIKNLVWTRDGNYLVASYAGAHGVRMFDRQGHLLRTDLFSGPSYGAAVSAQGKIAVAAFDGGIHLYAVTDKGIKPAGRLELPLPDPVSVSFSPDGAQVVVGYHSRNQNNQVQVDVVDLQKMQVTRSFSFPDIRYGNLMQVAWSKDGSKIYAAGTGYRDAPEFLLKAVEWPTGKVSEVVVARNSITKLVPLSQDRVAFSSFDSSWGIVRDGKVKSRRALSMAAVSSASDLKIHPDGSVVSWRSPDGASAITFDLKNRRLLAAVPSGLLETRTSSFMHFRITQWEDAYGPKINGIPVDFGHEEVSRAVAVLPDQSAVLLGTSWNLRKLDKAGKELWRVPVSTEVRAINVSQDSRTIVMAQVDGRVNWLRASDGATLLTLIMTADARWVLVNPSGYYDASAGAESLLGWQINRPEGETADFFPVSKFRDRFYRPDVIDQGLKFTSADEALILANAVLSQEAEDFARGGLRSPLTSGDGPLQQQLPPVIALAREGVVDAADDMVKISFSVFSQANTSINGWQVLVNGRPVQTFVIKAPVRTDGQAQGQLDLARPADSAKVQLFVSNQFGFSEPLTVDVQGSKSAIEQSTGSDKRPNLYVLAIGVAQYANSSLNLLFPAKDARDLVEVLRQQQGHQYKRVFHQTLTDTQASRQAITKGLQWLTDSATESDVAMLFIAGHGITVSGNSYRFLPHDANLSRPDETFITEDQIRDALVNVKGKAILFIDTCFSGKATGRFTRHDTKLIANRLSSAESGVIVFSSSDGRQESLEKEGWRNGAFTKELIAGLNGDADFRQEGVVTHKGLDYFVSHRVKQLTEGLQTPVTTVPIGIADYALTRYAVRPSPQVVNR